MEAGVCGQSTDDSLTMDKTIDDLVFLLSTDWFLVSWDASGLNSEEGAQKKFQGECRKLVKDLLNGADDYWDVELSEERFERTRGQFLAVLASSGLTELDQSALRCFVNGEAASIAEESLAINLLYLLVAETNGAIGSSCLSELVVNSVSAELSRVQSGAAIADGAWTIKSEWDSDIKRIREGSTDYLPVVAKNLAAMCSASHAVWSRLKTVLPQIELKSLAEWMNVRALDLTGQEIALE